MMYQIIIKKSEGGNPVPFLVEVPDANNLKFWPNRSYSKSLWEKALESAKEEAIPFDNPVKVLFTIWDWIDFSKERLKKNYDSKTETPTYWIEQLKSGDMFSVPVHHRVVFSNHEVPCPDDIHLCEKIHLQKVARLIREKFSWESEHNEKQNSAHSYTEGASVPENVSPIKGDGISGSLSTNWPQGESIPHGIYVVERESPPMGKSPYTIYKNGMKQNPDGTFPEPDPTMKWGSKTQKE